LLDVASEADILGVVHARRESPFQRDGVTYRLALERERRGSIPRFTHHEIEIHL
jgi:hypothetical protein